MKPMYKKIIFSLLFLLSAISGFNVSAAPDGNALYEEHCSVCHGSNGQGGVGVPLALPSFINSVSDAYLFKTIRHGRPGRIMPAFDALSDAQVKAITAFVRNWGDKEAPEEDNVAISGDAVLGKKIYDTTCKQCHGEDGHGGKGTGVTFSRKRDQPIIAPSLSNSGFLASASDTMIHDTIKSGRDGTPMTSQIAKGLSENDINNLVSYIRSFEHLNVSEKDADDEQNDQSAVIVMDSPYGMDETIENLKQAITGQNFTLIRVEPLETGFVKSGEENRKQMVVHFCNFGFLFKALAIDPRVGMFLPCRITIVENEDGKVQLMSINPLPISKLFNNDELDNACKEMYEVYSSLMEDAIL